MQFVITIASALISFNNTPLELFQTFPGRPHIGIFKAQQYAPELCIHRGSYAISRNCKSDTEPILIINTTQETVALTAHAEEVVFYLGVRSSQGGLVVGTICPAEHACLPLPYLTHRRQSVLFDFRMFFSNWLSLFESSLGVTHGANYKSLLYPFVCQSLHAGFKGAQAFSLTTDSSDPEDLFEYLTSLCGVSPVSIKHALLHPAEIAEGTSVCAVLGLHLPEMDDDVDFSQHLIPLCIEDALTLMLQRGGSHGTDSIPLRFVSSLGLSSLSETSYQYDGSLSRAYSHAGLTELSQVIRAFVNTQASTLIVSPVLSGLLDGLLGTDRHTCK